MEMALTRRYPAGVGSVWKPKCDEGVKRSKVDVSRLKLTLCQASASLSSSPMGNTGPITGFLGQHRLQQKTMKQMATVRITPANPVAKIKSILLTEKISPS